MSVCLSHLMKSVLAARFFIRGSSMILSCNLGYPLGELPKTPKVSAIWPFICVLCQVFRKQLFLPRAYILHCNLAHLTCQFFLCQIMSGLVRNCVTRGSYSPKTLKNYSKFPGDDVTIDPVFPHRFHAPKRKFHGLSSKCIHVFQ